MSALFIVAKRDRQAIFLEAKTGDRVGTLVDSVAEILDKDSDDVRLVYGGNPLPIEKTFGECHVSHEGEAIVLPLEMRFIFKVDGQWEEARVAEMSQPAQLPDVMKTEPEGQEKAA